MLDQLTHKTRTPVWNAILGVATVGCVVALVVLVARPDAIKIGAFTGELLAAVIIGISLIFSAVLLGSFLILREWIVSTSSLAAQVDEATRKAIAQFRELNERIPSNVASFLEERSNVDANNLADGSPRE